MILVCGDAMIDRYQFGDVSRLSPEAPVPVVSVFRVEDRMGAAANVEINIDALGGNAKLMVSESFYSEACIIKTRIIGMGQQICRLDNDYPQRALSVETVRAAADGCEFAVLCDYGKGALDNIKEIIAALKADGVFVIVDPKSRRVKDYAGCDVLKPNAAELRLLIGPWDSEDELEHKVKVMQRVTGIRTVLLTRGASGMTLFDGVVTNIKATQREVVDVCGAGDTAVAALAVALARGDSMPAAACYANAAAGIAVSRFGTVVVSSEELK